MTTDHNAARVVRMPFTKREVEIKAITPMASHLTEAAARVFDALDEDYQPRLGIRSRANVVTVPNMSSPQMRRRVEAIATTAARPLVCDARQQGSYLVISLWDAVAVEHHEPAPLAGTDDYSTGSAA